MDGDHAGCHQRWHPQFVNHHPVEHAQRQQRHNAKAHIKDPQAKHRK